MKNYRVKNFISVGSVLILSGTCFSLFSQNKSGDIQPGGAIKLEYNYPQDKIISYVRNSKMLQTMDFNGQSMEANINSSLGCSVRSIERQDKNMKLEIKIDTLGQATESPMGYSGGAATNVIGKTLSLIIAPTGKTIDFSEAQNLTYSIAEGGETDLSEVLNDFFPVIPENPVKIGDTWNSVDSTSTKTKSNSIKTLVNSTNKLEGIETVDGVECAKISSVVAGTMTINVQSQGSDIFIKGPFSGTSVLLFSVKDGYFVRQESKSKISGNMEMSAPQAMTIPIVMDVSAVIELKGKK